MTNWSRPFALAILLGAGFCAAGVSASAAVSSTTLDVLQDDPPNAKVEIGKVDPLTRQGPSTATTSRGGNPLWFVPLSVLTATQERPLFLATRRPPAKAVIGPRIEPPPPAPVAEKPIEPLSLIFIGAVVGDGEAIAVFLDQVGQGIVRLRQGESRSGWVVSSILQREVRLSKDSRTEVLVLPSTGLSPASSAPAGMPIVAPTQASGNSGTPYAPFIPRHTPKNGESDGL